MRFFIFFVSTLLVTSLMAKESPVKKKRDFVTIKQHKIAKLKERLETIQKRLNCIKNAKSSKEIKQCEKKYKLVKRKSKKKK